MVLKIHLKRPHAPLPELDAGQMRLVVAQEGVYLERRNEMFSSTTTYQGPLLGLESHRRRCVLHCGKIPAPMIRDMLGFFWTAQEVHGGEAALVLLYHPQKRRFRWYCPKQTVEIFLSCGRWRAVDSIRFENPLQLPDGFVRFGDAHSHPHISKGSPSYADVEDEVHNDGLHIIVSDLVDGPSYHIDFVVDGQRFRVAPEIILADTLSPPYPPPPKSWLRRVRLVKQSGWSSLVQPSHDNERESL
jgi:hypothetical protein